MSIRLKVIAGYAALALIANAMMIHHETMTTVTPVPLVLNVVDKPSVVTAKVCYSNNQCKKLAEAVFFEGRGESIRGQYAVAFTVINRRDSGKYPDTIDGVIAQKRRGICQFSYVCQIKPVQRQVMIKDAPVAWNTALEVAYNAYFFEVKDPTRGADHYHTKQVKPVWRKQLYPILALGNHVFYRS